VAYEFDIDRMCRLNGQKPTARDCWVAFYRLYRVGVREEETHQGMLMADGALNCLRVLFGDNRFLRLCRAKEEKLGRVRRWPAFLLRRRLEIERRERLYNGNWHWQERDKVVAARCHAQGLEVTPDQVAEVRRKVLNSARRVALARGIRLPENEDDILHLLNGVEE